MSELWDVVDGESNHSYFILFRDIMTIDTSLYYRPTASWITLIYLAKPWPYRYLSLIGTAQP